jgi:hypothetical protein
MLLPEHFKAYVKIRIDNQNYNKYEINSIK